MLLIAAGTGGSLGTSFRICPPIPTATPRQDFLFSRKGPLSSLFGKPASGPSPAKSNFVQELHGRTPKSQRHFQTQKSISKFGVKVYLSIMMRSAQAPFPIPSFHPQKTAVGPKILPSPHAELLLGPSQTSHISQGHGEEQKTTAFL